MSLHMKNKLYKAGRHRGIMRKGRITKSHVRDMLTAAVTEALAGKYQDYSNGADWTKFAWTGEVEVTGPFEFIVEAEGQRFRVTVSKPQ